MLGQPLKTDRKGSRTMQLNAGRMCAEWVGGIMWPLPTHSKCHVMSMCGWEGWRPGLVRLEGFPLVWPEGEARRAACRRWHGDGHRSPGIRPNSNLKVRSRPEIAKVS